MPYIRFACGAHPFCDIRPAQDLLDRGDRRDVLERGSKEVGIDGQHRHERADAPRQFVDWDRGRLPRAQRFYLGIAGTVDGNLRVILRSDIRFRNPIELVDDRARIA